MNLRVIGTEVYTHIPKQNRRKWDPKAKLGVLVGYDNQAKGYRVFMNDTRTVSVHRDVNFKDELKDDRVHLSAAEHGEEDDAENYYEFSDNGEEEDSESDANENESDNEDVEPVEVGGHRLRNRNNIPLPPRLNDYIHEALFSARGEPL